MIVVVGHLLVDAEHRDRAVELSRSAVLAARSTAGCIDFALGADTVDPARINVCERWSDRDALDRFRGSGPGGELGDLIHEVFVEEYEV